MIEPISSNSNMSIIATLERAQQDMAGQRQAAQAELFKNALEGAFKLGQKFKAYECDIDYLSFASLKANTLALVQFNHHNVENGGLFHTVFNQTANAKNEALGSLLETAFHLGELRYSLKERLHQLCKENLVLKSQIEQLKITQEEKWAAKLKYVETQLDFCAAKISAVVQEHEVWLQNDLITRALKLIDQNQPAERVSTFLGLAIAYPQFGTAEAAYKLGTEADVIRRYLPQFQEAQQTLEKFSFVDIQQQARPSSLILEHLELIKQDQQAGIDTALCMTLPFYQRKIEPLQTKIQKRKSQNSILVNEKEKMIKIHDIVMNNLMVLTYSHALRSCLEKIHLIAFDAKERSKALNTDIPNRTGLQAVCWKSYADKCSNLQKQAMALWAELCSIALEFMTKEDRESHEAAIEKIRYEHEEG